MLGGRQAGQEQSFLCGDDVQDGLGVRRGCPYAGLSRKPRPAKDRKREEKKDGKYFFHKGCLKGCFIVRQ
jgi:hypothetical protein